MSKKTKKRGSDRQVFQVAYSPVKGAIPRPEGPGFRQIAYNEWARQDLLAVRERLDAALLSRDSAEVFRAAELALAFLAEVADVGPPRHAIYESIDGLFNRR